MNEVLEIYLYDDISSDRQDFFWGDIPSDTSAKSVHRQLAEVPPDAPVALHINSYGGEVKEGAAIYSLLKQHSGPVTVYVDGFACSVASLIAMAGDRVIMGRPAMMMIHRAWTAAAGNADDLRKAADDLDKITQAMSAAYLERCGDRLTAEKLEEMLKQETWLDAAQCVAYGLADEIGGESPGKGLEQAKQSAAAQMRRVPHAPSAEAQNNAERLMKAFKKMEVTA